MNRVKKALSQFKIYEITVLPRALGYRLGFELVIYLSNSLLTAKPIFSWM
jgi:hypothetical protein